MQRIRDFLRQAREPMYANAYALVANQVLSAGIGFVYWIVATNLYATATVGRSDALISTLLLVAGLADLGLKSGMTRFVPRAGRHVRRLVASAYAVTALAAAVFSLALLAVARALRLDALGAVAPGVVVVATVAWTLFYLQDGVLIGLRRAAWVLAENTVYNLSKVVLLVAGVTLLGEAGIVGSYFLPAPVMVVLVGLLVFGVFTRRDALPDAPRGSRPTVREIATSVAGDHTGSVVAQTAVRLMPLLVVAVLGASATAYFSRAWLISATLMLIATNMTHSFSAEAAADRTDIARLSRGILRQTALLVVPIAAVVGLGAPLVLRVFGPDYVTGATLLRWLALATLPVIFNTWYLAYSLLVGRVRRAMGLQVLSSVLLVGLGWLGLSRFGLAGVGVAWLTAQSSVTLLTLPDALRVLWPSAEEPVEVSLSTLLRRADWRFLMPSPDPGRTAVFGDGLLRRAVEAVGGEVVDPASSGDGGCDTAVLRGAGADALSRAAALLRPGGACYIESASWSPRTVRRTIRELAAAGFVDVRAWWPFTVGGTVGLWLEVEPRSPRYRGAVRAFLARRLPGLAGRVSGAIVSVALAARWVPRPAFVARRPGGATDGYLPERLAEGVAKAAGVPADALQLVTRTGGNHYESKVNWLVYAGDPPRVRWIAKTARHPAGAEGLRNEHRALELLAVRARPGLAAPSELSFADDPGTPLLVQEALEGTPLTAVARTREYADVCALASQALAAFAGRPAPSPRERWAPLLDPALAQLEEQLALLGSDLAGDVRRALRGLGPLPLVFAHNDFAPWNVLLAEGGLAAFDWEDATPEGLPAVDLVYFMATTAFGLDGIIDTPECVRTYERLLDVSRPRGAAFVRALDAYAAAVGLAEADLPRLRVATWLMHTVQDLEALLADDASPTPALLERSVCLPLLRADVLAVLGEPGEAGAAATMGGTA